MDRSAPPRPLTAWDRRLLKRHLSFYHALDTGARPSTTAAQFRFIEVCRGKRRPATQHEWAYYKYLRWQKRRQAQGATGNLEGQPFRIPSPPEVLIATVREEVTDDSPSSKINDVLDYIRHSYSRSAASLKSASAEAAIWINATLAESDFSAEAERWMGQTFNTLSDVYTQAMDQKFLDGLKGLGPILTPGTHRIVDGGHTLAGAWDAVQAALPDDTFSQEVAGYFSALASDISSKSGLPLVTLSPESLDSLTTGLRDALGLSHSWVLDALTVNAVELLGTTTGVVAAALNWSEADREKFSRISASLALSTIATANPLLAVVTIVMLAKAFQDAKSVDQYAEAATGMLKGGSVTGVVMATGSLVGGPAWIGLMVGLCLGVAASKRLASVSAADTAALARKVSAFAASQLGRLSGSFASRTKASIKSYLFREWRRFA